MQVLGASYYLLAIHRQSQCWRQTCGKETNATHSPSCTPRFLDCDSLGDPARAAWYNKLTSLSSVMLKMKTAHSHLEFMLMLLLMKLHHLDSLKDIFIASGGS